MSEHETKLIRNSTADFLIFTAQAGEDSIEVRYEDETVWLSRKMMATLFDVDIRTVNEHLKNIFEQGELVQEATIRKFRMVQAHSTSSAHPTKLQTGNIEKIDLKKKN